jgi:hypothetical protein
MFCVGFCFSVLLCYDLLCFVMLGHWFALLRVVLKYRGNFFVGLQELKTHFRLVWTEDPIYEGCLLACVYYIRSPEPLLL